MKKNNVFGWEGSCVGKESSMQQISPYIGKMKSSMVNALLVRYTKVHEKVWDPFVGSGVVALQSVINGRNIISNDINPYAIVLTKAKLFHPSTELRAIRKANFYFEKLEKTIKTTNITAPKWVRAFFNPKTLKEIIILKNLFIENNEFFLLGCLLGILHHQRPGFLSYPSNHLVPYLLTRKFPKNKFPEMYTYRDVKSRLLKKINRAYKREANKQYSVTKECKLCDTTKLRIAEGSIDAIVTSPPYMNNLDYARDNRLRLWFLGIKSYSRFDQKNATKLKEFLTFMKKCFTKFHKVLKRNGKCILVVGDVIRNRKKSDIAKSLIKLAENELKYFKCINVIEDKIPKMRRTRRSFLGTKKETIIVLKRIN